MKTLKKSNIFRFVTVLLALSLTLFAVPNVQAAKTNLRINILAVDKNNKILVEAVNFPANQLWNVRIGTYYGFSRDNVTVGQIDAPNGGNFQFVVQLPEVVKDVDLVSVRLDSQTDYYVYNAFHNVSRGKIPDVGSGQIIIPVTGTTPSGNSTCVMNSVTLTSTIIMPANNDFTTIWEVKNNGSNNLEESNVDLKFINGISMHRDGSLFDLASTVQPGQTIRVSVNMRSPSQTGIYTANWALVNGSTILCNLPVTIIVP